MTPQELPEATYDLICLLARPYIHDLGGGSAANLEQDINDYLQRNYPFGFTDNNLPCNRVEVRINYQTRTFDIQFVET